MKKKSFLDKKISNRFAYTIISVVALAIFGVFVYAVEVVVPGDQATPNPGHSISQIGTPAGCSTNQFLKWNGNSWTCSTIEVGESIWDSSGDNIYYNNGNVGIGTNEPGQRIQVEGNAIITGNLIFKPGSSITLPGQGTDEDGDGYFRQGTFYFATIINSSGMETTQYNGNDCYDSNIRAYPGEPFYYNIQRGDGSFDYNCDGQITYEIQQSVQVDNTCRANPRNWFRWGGDTEYLCSLVYEYYRRIGGNPTCFTDIETCNNGNGGTIASTRPAYRR